VRSRPGEALLQVVDKNPDPERRLDQLETAAAVQAALAAVPTRQRMAVVLSRFEGLSYQEIATAVRLPQFFADVDLHTLTVHAIQPLGPGTGRGQVPTPMF